MSSSSCIFLFSPRFFLFSSLLSSSFFFFNDTAPPEIYTLSLHDALPIFTLALAVSMGAVSRPAIAQESEAPIRSEEHTSELQSLTNLVCRLLLEKKKKKQKTNTKQTETNDISQC